MGDTNTAITPPGGGETSAAKPTMLSKVMSEIMAAPELKGVQVPVAPEKKAAAEAVVEITPADKAVVVPADGETAKKDGETDDENHEIVEGDSAEVQLKKLAASQKKTLKRIDKLTAERNELETKLQAALEGKPGEADAATVEAPALAHIQTLDDLKSEDTRLKNWIQHLVKHAGTGLTYKGADGADVTMSAEDVVNDINYWADVAAIQVPARRQFIESRDKTRTEAVEKFKPWTNQKGFTDAKAEVEKGMKPAESLLSDYDLAVQERALGRLALSDEWELVPKRKVPNGSVESAPAKKEPVVPPVNPPPSGGPPIKPAGSGPDVEALRQNMLKNPGNQAAVDAYVKAKMTASRAR